MKNLHMLQLSNMINTLLKSSVLFFFMQVVLAADLNLTANTNQQTSAISQKLKLKFPDLHVDSITPSELPNIYQVIAGHHIIYVDATASYMVLGNIISLKDNSNITTDKMNGLNVIDWKALDKTSALVHYPASGKSTSMIAVFINPDCPFCSKYLSEVLLKLENVTIYFYLVPLKTHPDSELHIKQILCSVDPEKSMIKYMVDNIPLTADTKCVNAKNEAKNADIAHRLIDLQGTPTTVFSNGKILAGMLDIDYLKGLMK
jgi:thiol:disulfide interchange protein DsbC